MKREPKSACSWRVHFGENNYYFMHCNNVLPYITLQNALIYNLTHMRMVHCSINKDTLSSKQCYF